MSTVSQLATLRDRAVTGVAAIMFGMMVAFFAIGGLWCLKAAFADSLENKAAISWSKASGRITEARVEEVGSNDARAMYVPSVIVRYEVSGKWYSCNRIYAGYGSTSNSCQVTADVAPYVAGNKVMVFYNPDSPTDSMLRPGSHGVNMLFMIVGAVMVGASLLIGIPLLKSTKAVQSAQKLHW